MSGSEFRDGTSNSVNSCSASSSRRSGNSDSSESTAEGEEQEDSSSSSSNSKPQVKFRWLLRRLLKLERLTRLVEDIPDVSPFIAAKGIFSGQTQTEKCTILVRGVIANETTDLQMDNLEDELSNFRELWKKDISLKNKFKESQVVVDEENNREENEIHLKAEKWFLEGVENEKNGRLHEAIKFYKKAEQLVPDIEFKLCSSAGNKQKDSSQTKYIDESVDEKNEDLKLPESEKNSEDEDEEDKDLELIFRLQNFISRSKSICTPANAQTMTHISSLPMEIILYILRWVVSHELDMRSLEMCSMVCRGFYVCSRDPEIWRLACLRVWGVNCGGLKNYDSWRSMFLQRPRLNFNGFYISRTTYIRHGENSFQDQFYRPWHLVEYFRYFRFFPGGVVFMLTTPDQPSQVTYILKGREHKHPSVLPGHYRLQDDRVFIILHRDDLKNNMFRKRKTNIPPDLIEQTYHIELQVLNRKHRINHCLMWKRYCVTSLRGNTETKTNFEVMSNKFPSFWFSRVKSYTNESEKPLV